MSLCINPTCPKPNHPLNSNNRYCQSCGSELLLQGRYRVMQLLSDNSGFGTIYTAEERGTLKILKVLKEHHNNDAKAVELFEQEAKVLGELNHPGIPKVDWLPFQGIVLKIARLFCNV
jgi:serine/threonine protein kinase